MEKTSIFGYNYILNHLAIYNEGCSELENFWVELVRLIPQLIVTFVGVFLAFMLDRAIERYKKWRNRKGLLHDLHSELEGVIRKLTGEGNLHFPDIWKSAISSGQIRLLSSEQVTKLASVYGKIQGIEYEARRLRDLAEDYRTCEFSQRKGILKREWEKWSTIQFQREMDLKKKIKTILKEEWWS